jgi:hypothetical protein
VNDSCDLVALNALLKGLLRDDIGIKKYYALIGSIGLQRDGSSGFIAYHTSGTGSWRLGNDEAGPPVHDVEFSTDNVDCFTVDAGNSLQLRTTQQRPLTFSTISFCLQVMILREALKLESFQKINIDTSDDYRRVCRLFSVCRHWRNSFDITVGGNSFEIEVTHTGDQGKIYGFGKLKRFLQYQRLRERLHIDLHMDGDYEPDLRIAIVFDSTDITRLRDVRFDAVKLLEATFMVRGDVDIIISFRTRGILFRKSKVKQKTYSLQQIRKAALLAWPAGPDCHYPCPEIWMDNKCNIVKSPKVEGKGRAVQETDADIVRRLATNLLVGIIQNFVSRERWVILVPVSRRIPLTRGHRLHASGFDGAARHWIGMTTGRG